MAREVEIVSAVTRDVEEAYDDRSVRAGVTGLTEGALILVPTPEYRHLSSPVIGRSCGGWDGEEADQNGEKDSQGY
ncbi:hypothetical protein PR202_gb12914 [Eleusine coracana subsp. coracana]|uniref:Uncharacterized protein n=1 Tax=Eleusine coracana subsp. coracana TaxID=191504 RepID=A0AAV5ESD0_ELECO|nr:hypothetical protein PR202_gb12914 [Eleusine coracana subsp. coracana]